MILRISAVKFFKIANDCQSEEIFLLRDAPLVCAGVATEIRYGAIK